MEVNLNKTHFKSTHAFGSVACMDGSAYLVRQHILEMVRKKIEPKEIYINSTIGVKAMTAELYVFTPEEFELFKSEFKTKLYKQNKK